MKARSKLVAKIAVGALVVALSLLGVGVAQADSGVFAIENLGTDLCLQPEGGVTHQIVPIVLKKCDNTDVQRWLFQPFGGANRFQIANVATNLCLNAFDGAHDNARVLQVQCVPISNEQWKASGPLPGVVTLMSRERFTDTDFCIDVPFNLPAENVAVQLFRCNTTNAQRWEVRAG